MIDNDAKRGFLLGHKAPRGTRQDGGCPWQAMHRVASSQCLEAMPSLHVLDGLEFSRQMKIQERLPMRYPSPKGFIGGPWVFVRYPPTGYTLAHVDAEVSMVSKGACEVQL